MSRFAADRHLAGEERNERSNTLATPIRDASSLWDIDAVALRLGVRVRHVRRLVAERRIPFIKWGRLLRFDPDEIEAWLNEARRPPVAG
jgi:excisionase family DNA binding protein